MKSISLHKTVWLILAVGIITTSLFGLFVRNHSSQENLTHFEAVTEMYFASVEKEISYHLQYLKGIKNFYESSDFVSRDEFQTFVTQHLETHSSIQALEWIPRVTLEKRPEFEKFAQADGLGQYSISERLANGKMVSAEQREVYYPVYYVEPLEGNRAAVGFDLGSNPTRLAAIKKAVQSGELVASSKITLVQENASQSGVLVFEPIFNTEISPTTSAEPSVALKGFVLGVFRVGNLLESAIANHEDVGIDIILRDVTESDQHDELHIILSGNGQRTLNKLLLSESQEIPNSITRSLLFGGRTWELQFIQSEFYLNSKPIWPYWLIGFLFIFFTLIVAKNTQNILDSKKELEATTVSRDYAESITNSIADILLILQPDKTIQATNPAARNLLGYSENELVGMQVGKLFDNKIKIKSLTVDDYLLCKDGSVFPVSISSSRLFSGTETAETEQGAVWVLHDLRESLATENELLNKINALNETSTVAITDVKGKITYANQKFCEVSKYSEIELLGQDHRIVNSGYHSKEFFENLWHTINSGKVWRGEVKNKAKDASLYWVDTTIIPQYDINGELEQFIDICNEITERKNIEARLLESEQRSRLALESSKAGMWDRNVETGETFFDQRWLEMLEYTEGELEGVIKSWQDLVHPDERPEVMKVLTAHEEGKTPGYHSVYRCKTKSGRWKWIFDTGQVISRDQNNKPLRIIGTHIDITAQIELENQLRQSQKMEAIGTLAGGVAHDFNNILQAVTSGMELMEMDIPEDSPLRPDLNSLQKLLKRASGLVSQILTYSRYNTEKQVVVEVVPILKESLKMLRATLPATVEIETIFSLPQAQIKGNETQMHQVIVNLCVNAGHAMEKSGGLLTVVLEKVELHEKTTVSLDPKLNYCCLRIQDTGCGMPPDVISRIFEPFFTTKDKSKGTGLGLSVIEGIIEMHRGHIHVESEEGKGTTFEVFLPLIEEKAKPEATDDHTPEKSTETEPYRILLVDDEEEIIRTQKIHLMRLGHQVQTCVDGKSAFKKLQENPQAFDLIITDQTMPGMTGMQLSHKCKELWPELPIILTTGYSIEELPERIEDAGICALLPKPHTQTELVKLVKEIMA